MAARNMKESRVQQAEYIGSEKNKNGPPLILQGETKFQILFGMGQRRAKPPPEGPAHSGILKV